MGLDTPGKGSEYEEVPVEDCGGRDARPDSRDRGRGGLGKLPAFGCLTALDSCHPAIPVAFFTAVLVLTMAAIQPVLAAISLASALVTSAFARGLRATVASLLWQLPLVALVAVANPLFSASGSTVLFRFGYLSVHAESLYYGAVMGCVLVSVIVWFQAASATVSSDKVMATIGLRFPLVSLMVSMSLRLVPRFVARGREIDAVHRACTSSRAFEGSEDEGDTPSARPRRRALATLPARRVRQVSVLMGWSMEDSLETADSMRARGWRRDVRRTCYRRWSLGGRDSALLAALAFLAVCAGFVAWAATVQFRFYPTATDLSFWWGYAVYAAFFLFPLIVQGEEALRWRR